MKQTVYGIIATTIVGAIIWLTPATPTQATVNDTPAIKQLASLLSGEFDSFKQRQDDRNNKVEKSQFHGWVNRAFVMVDAPKVADIVLVGSTIYSGKIVDENEYLVWTFKQNADASITMTPQRFKDLHAKLAYHRDADKLAGFSTEDLEGAISGAACDITWTKSSTGFTGQSEPCRVMSTTRNKMLNWSWSYKLDSDSLSIAFSGTDDTGKVLDTTPEGNPYRLNRLTPESYYQQGKELLFNAQERSEYAISQTLLERAVKNDPQNGAAKVALIYAYTKSNRYSNAQALLPSAEALEDTLSPSEALWLAGMQARVADDYDQEIEVWTKLLEIDPKQQWAWYELASIYYRSELYQQTVDAIQGAFAAEPDEDKWGASYIYYLHSKSLYRIGKVRKSIAASEPGIRNKNTQRATYYRKVIAQIASGEINDPSDALARYREMSTKDGKVNEAVLQTNIALLFFELGDYPTAIKHAKAGYKLSQKPYHAWALAYSLTEHGDTQQALEILNLANKAHPDSLNILAGLGWAYYRSEQLELANEYLLAAQKASPRKNSGVERDLKTVQAAMINPETKQVPAVRWFGD